MNGISFTKPIDNLTAYIYTALRNKVKDLLKRKRISTVDINMISDDLQNHNPAISRSIYTPEEEHERLQLANLLVDALESISEEQREIFILTELEGQTYQEISEKTGISVNTLLARKRYAMAKLKEILS